jgi:hypothetical protein
MYTWLSSNTHTITSKGEKQSDVCEIILMSLLLETKGSQKIYQFSQNWVIWTSSYHRRDWEGKQLNHLVYSANNGQGEGGLERLTDNQKTNHLKKLLQWLPPGWGGWPKYLSGRKEGRKCHLIVSLNIIFTGRDSTWL